MKTKILILLISCMLIASAASAKRIYEYTNLGALADADEFLVSKTSDSNREFAVTGTVVKTYIGTNVALTLGDLSDLKIDIGASDEDLISATPANKNLQTYTATAIDTLLLSAGSVPTIQADDPEASDVNGWYLATGSGDLFYIGDTGIFTIAGAYSAWDIAPTAFTFTDETDIALSTAKVSDTKTVAGIDRTAAISVTGDTGFGYKKNGSACTTVAGTVVNTDTFNACVTSSGSYSTATSATVTVGSASDVYSVTTLAASAPTLSSRTIGTNGTSLTLVGSESLSVGAGGNAGFDVDCATAGNGITATYASGAPGASLVYTLGTTVNSGDTCDLDYTQPGNGIEATNGGTDLASITSGAITNNSTQGVSTYYRGYRTNTELSSPPTVTDHSNEAGYYDGTDRVQLSEITMPAGSTLQKMYLKHGAGVTASNLLGVCYVKVSATEAGAVLTSGAMPLTANTLVSATFSSGTRYFADETNIYCGVAIDNPTSFTLRYYETGTLHLWTADYQTSPLGTQTTSATRWPVYYVEYTR